MPPKLGCFRPEGRCRKSTAHHPAVGEDPQVTHCRAGTDVSTMWKGISWPRPTLQLAPPPRPRLRKMKDASVSRAPANPLLLAAHLWPAAFPAGVPGRPLAAVLRVRTRSMMKLSGSPNLIPGRRLGPLGSRSGLPWGLTCSQQATLSPSATTTPSPSLPPTPLKLHHWNGSK